MTGKQIKLSEQGTKDEQSGTDVTKEQKSKTNSWKQKSLSPIILSKEEDSYRTVEDLKNAVSQDDILNIAVTGPYGSGKSSVLRTFQKEIGDRVKILDISLATLDADESMSETKDDDFENELSGTNRNEILNRKIEYSILQQLVYRKKLEDLPFSRLSKIRHISSGTISQSVVYFIGYIVCLTFTFDIKWLQLPYLFETSLNLYSGIRLISGLFFVLMSYEILKFLLNFFAGIRPQKISIGGNEIDVNKESSIFNQYLDEILYFFQCTDYDVVLIEDLDRFNTTDIFLKLRELNYIINKSEIVGRKIRFIYAVKDDMFKDSSRSKFFDYITTVIPVITTSNSKDMLKRALEDIGHKEEISNDNIRDIAFHIDDMRLLFNIVNEYDQYSARLNNNKEHPLEARKMLAMIVVKNYHPHDFSQLHNRKGKLYSALSHDAKCEYIDYAINKVLAERIEIAENNLKAFEASCHLSEKELRSVYLYAIMNRIPNEVSSIVVEDNHYTISKIIESEEIFEKLIAKNIVKYGYYRQSSYLRTDSIELNFTEIEKQLNPNFTYTYRLNQLRTGRKLLVEKIEAVKREKLLIKSYPIKDLIVKFNIYQADFFKEKGLSPMEEDFVRIGLLSEDYNDYISYFYPDILSLSDHQLCLDMKLDRPTSYSAPIDDVKLFLAELPVDALRFKSVWNITLLDYLAEHKVLENEYYNLFIDNLVTNDSSDFLSAYLSVSEYNKRVFSDCMKLNAEKMWQKCQDATNETSGFLLLFWFVTCDIDDIKKAQIIWINSHYSLMTLIYGELTNDKRKYYSSNFNYEKLTAESTDMLNEVVQNGCYVLNEANIPFVVHVKQAKNDIGRLASVEEKQLALSMGLVDASWHNINDYYNNCDEVIDDTLVKFVESHVENLIADSFDITIQDNLYQSLMENKNMADETYTSLCKMRDIVVDVTEEILSLPEEKLVLLIHHGKIEENDDFLQSLATISAKATCEYILHYKEHLTHLLQQGIMSTELAETLLNNRGFNQIEYQKIIASLTPTSVDINTLLAEKICTIMSTQYSVCDESILFSAIKQCNDENKSVLTAARKIEQAGSDANKITELINCLPEKYHELSSVGKHPKLDDTPHNLFLVKILAGAQYISSYTVDKGKIRVHTKRK